MSNEVNNSGWTDTVQHSKSVCFTPADLQKAQAAAQANSKDPGRYVYMEQVEGIYRGESSVPSKKGPMILLNIEQANGELVSVRRTTVLKTKFEKGFKSGPIPVGILVRIRYLGEQASKGAGGNTYQNYSVMTKEASFTEVAPQETGAPVEEPSDEEAQGEY